MKATWAIATLSLLVGAVVAEDGPHGEGARAEPTEGFSKDFHVRFRTRPVWPAGVPVLVEPETAFGGARVRELHATAAFAGAERLTVYDGGGPDPGLEWRQSIGVPPAGVDEIRFAVVVVEGEEEVWSGTVVLEVKIEGTIADVIRPHWSAELERRVREVLARTLRVDRRNRRIQFDDPCRVATAGDADSEAAGCSVTLGLRLEFVDGEELVAWSEKVISREDPQEAYWVPLQGDSERLGAAEAESGSWQVRVRGDGAIALGDFRANDFWEGEVVLPLTPGMFTGESQRSDVGETGAVAAGGPSESEWIVYQERNSGLVDNIVYALLESPEGVYWIGTQRGVSRFDGTSWTTLNSWSSGLPLNEVRAIARDSGGALWFGTLGGGVARYDQKNWRVFNRSNSGLAADWVLSLQVDAADGVWVGTVDGGLSHFDGASWRTFDTSNSPVPSDNIRTIFVGALPSVWVGTLGGLAEFDGARWRVFTTENSPLPYHVVSSVTMDAAGVLWIGTAGGREGGLSRFDGETWKLYDSSNSTLVGNSASEVLIDRCGQMWISAAGLPRFDGETWSRFEAGPTALPHRKVGALMEDHRGRLWVGTRGGVAVIPDACRRGG